MLKRIVEGHQNESFSGIENARKYAEESEKSSKTRFRGLLNKLTDLDIKGNYLEVGAGSGTLAGMIVERDENINITGIEISTDMVTVANEYIKKKGLEKRINIINGDIEDKKLIKELGKFDLIYSTFSLHHWDNPNKVITNLMQYLNDNGVLLIYDLKRVWWLYWVPKQNGFFKSIRASYKPKEIEEILDTIGIKNYKIENIFPFFMQNITIWK